MNNCTNERMCSNCFSGQGICEIKKLNFLKELTDLSYNHNLVISVNANNGMMFLHERDKGHKHCEGYREVINGSEFIEWCDA